MIGDPAKKLNGRGQCCGRKPIVYKRDPHFFCCRCHASFNLESGEQIPNWAYEKLEDGSFRDKPAKR